MYRFRLHSCRLAGVAVAVLALSGCSDSPTKPADTLPPLVWQTLAPLPTTSDFYAAQWLGPNEFVGVGRYGRITHYNDGTWEAMQKDGDVDQNLWAVSGTQLDNLVAVGDAGEATFYNGMWWPADTSGVDVNLRGVWRSPGGVAWAVGEGGAIIRDVGSGWAEVASPTQQSLFSVWGSGDDDIFAAGDGGTVIHYNGSVWEAMDTGTGETLAGISGAGPADVIAVGNNGVALHYDGAAWQPLDTGTPDVLQSVRVFGHDDALAVGANGAILRYAGGAWAPDGSPVREWLFGVTGASADDAFAVGSRMVLHRNAGGWSAVTGLSPRLNACALTPLGHAIVGGRSGTILRYVSGRWQSMGSPTVSDINGVWAASDDDITMVCNAGNVYHYRTDTWFRELDTGPDYHGIDGLAGGPVWVVGDGGRVIRRNDTSTWLTEASHTTRDLYGVWALSADFAVAVGETGEIVEYTDQWRRVASPSLALLYEVAGWTEHTAGQRTHVYAVGAAGTILHRDPATGVWEVMESGVDVDLYAVCSARGGDMVAIGEQGVALQLSAGEWESISAPTAQTLRGLAPFPAGGLVVVGGTGNYDGTALLYAPQ